MPPKRARTKVPQRKKRVPVRRRIRPFINQSQSVRVNINQGEPSHTHTRTHTGYLAPSFAAERLGPAPPPAPNPLLPPPPAPGARHAHALYMAPPDPVRGTTPATLPAVYSNPSVARVLAKRDSLNAGTAERILRRTGSLPADVFNSLERSPHPLVNPARNVQFRTPSPVGTPTSSEIFSPPREPRHATPKAQGMINWFESRASPATAPLTNPRPVSEMSRTTSAAPVRSLSQRSSSMPGADSKPARKGPYHPRKAGESKRASTSTEYPPGTPDYSQPGRPTIEPSERQARAFDRHVTERRRK
jgi:hypothetical protein